MDEPHKKRRRIDEGQPSEADSSSAEDPIVQSSPLVSASFPDDLILKIICLLAIPETSEHVANFAQTCRRAYSLAKQCMRWKKNLPAISMELKPLNGRDFEEPEVRISLAKTHRMFDGQFDELRNSHGINWITKAESKMLVIPVYNERFEVSPLINKVIGKTVNELYIGEISLPDEYLPNISKEIGNANIGVVYVRYTFHICQFDALATFFEQRKGRRVEFHGHMYPPRETRVKTREDIVADLRRIFRRVDIVFNNAVYLCSLCRLHPAAFFAPSHMKDVFTMIHEESGRVEVNGVVMHPPFDLSQFVLPGYGLVCIAHIGLFASNRQFIEL